MTSSKNTGQVITVTARRIVSVPVSNSAAVKAAATTTLPASAPAIASAAASIGNRQSRPSPARRTTRPISMPCSSDSQGNMRLISRDAIDHRTLKRITTIRPAMSASRSDWAATSEAPAPAVGPGGIVAACFSGSRKTLVFSSLMMRNNTRVGMLISILLAAGACATSTLVPSISQQ